MEIQQLRKQNLIHKLISKLPGHRKTVNGLPRELSHHPLHLPDHPLILLTELPPYFSKYVICEDCRDIISSGSVYHCDKCQFNLHVKCALSTIDKVQRSSRGLETKLDIYHFSHDTHKLIYLSVGEELIQIDCSGCQLPLSGPGYGCLHCEFFLHKSCAELPEQIQHPYHPTHPLSLRFSEYGTACVACQMPIKGIFYHCSICEFDLHIPCSNNSLGVLSALKHKGHEHELYCFVPCENLGGTFQCKICGSICKGSVYICFECKCYFHLECIPLPSSIEHDCHFHSLSLINSFVEDDSGQYYCDACEKRRDPRYPVYHCKECRDDCPYIAHIECAVSEGATSMTKLTDAKSGFGKASGKAVEKGYAAKPGELEIDTKYLALAQFDESIGKPQCKRQIEIEDFSDDHILTLHKEGVEDCYGCKTVILGSYYSCEYCKIKLHKLCAELPIKLRHHLHCAHSLGIFHPYYRMYFICDGCKCIFYGVPGYECNECQFRLHMECAFLTEDHCVKLKEKGDKVTISHFSHPEHRLTLADCVSQLVDKCRACQLPILGSTSIYACAECCFFLHKSCISQLEQKIQHPYHLHELPLRYCNTRFRRCKACQMEIDHSSAYECYECNFLLHFTCANYLTSTLKHKCHEHNLFCFVTSDLRKEGFIQSKPQHHSKNMNTWNPFKCNTCGKKCEDSFYRCVMCDFNIHLECIRVPVNVYEKECHYDILTLKDSMYEDDSGTYYCDICEKPRNPNQPVYYCEECNVLIAHIGCILSSHETKKNFRSLSLKDNYGGDCCDTCEKPGSPNRLVYYCNECKASVANIGCVISEPQSHYGVAENMSKQQIFIRKLPLKALPSPVIVTSHKGKRAFKSLSCNGRLMIRSTWRNGETIWD